MHGKNSLSIYTQKTPAWDYTKEKKENKIILTIATVQAKVSLERTEK